MAFVHQPSNTGVLATQAGTALCPQVPVSREPCSSLSFSIIQPVHWCTQQETGPSGADVFLSLAEEEEEVEAQIQVGNIVRRELATLINHRSS